jgi:protein-disulfide isomerase
LKAWFGCGVLAVSLGVSGMALAQAPAAGAPAAGAAKQTAPANAPKAAPLQLQTLPSETKADPFPPVNMKYFTAKTPSVATVDAFLRALWGYDPQRIWRVEAIQTTLAPGVSKVVVYVSEKTANAKVQTAVFHTTPDGHYAVADQAGVVPFGDKPYADVRAKLMARADGPAKGAASKDMLLVEFSDLQCPHCKDAQKTMDQLVQDFPKARVVFQSFPLTTIHPFAMQAAEYGYCVQAKSPEAYFTYATAVYDTQAALTPETGVATLNAAVTKAGLDPAAISTCAGSDAIKEKVEASIKLGEDAGVDQTPMISVNGRLLPLTGIPYETLKTIIIFQAQQDGVDGFAPALTGFGPR